MYYVGLDLGQKRDHTAIAVVERWDVVRPYQGTEFGGVRVVYAQRVALRTPYPVVVERVREVVQSGDLRGRCGLAVDATGVGAPVVDQLRVAQLGCPVTAVTITSGELAHASGGSGSAVGGAPRWSVPKRDLMTGLEVLLERGELKIARGLGEKTALVRELGDMRMTRKSGGYIKVGADGSGEHDDLVIAVALACWLAKRQRSPYGTGRLAGM